jgi:hypothetical protein
MSKLFILCLLGVFAVTALDTLPDPPALHTHRVGADSIVRQAHRVREQRPTNEWSCTSSHVQVRWIALTLGEEPHLARDLIVLTQHAADPSPPILEAQHT